MCPVGFSYRIYPQKQFFPKTVSRFDSDCELHWKDFVKDSVSLLQQARPRLVFQCVLRIFCHNQNSSHIFRWHIDATSEKAMAPHSSTLAWKIPWMEEPGRLQSMGCEESDMTERLHFQFSLSCIGEGNGNPLQCSCLENPRDRGAWWAAIYGVAQSRTRLKWLSSSSSSSSSRCYLTSAGNILIEEEGIF